jgi:hypothetical protein
MKITGANLKAKIESYILKVKNEKEIRWMEIKKCHRVKA